MQLKRTQYGYTLYAFFFTAIIITGIFLLDSHKVFIFNWQSIAVLVLLLFVLLGFYKLTIWVDDKKIQLSFGPGWFSRSYDLSDIESCKPVRNRWWHGWGIRFTPSFTLYNVSGFDAVELTFKHHKRKVRIGVKNARDVAAIINHNLKMITDGNAENERFS